MDKTALLSRARELKAMCDEGLITKEEFENEKKKLLEQTRTSSTDNSKFTPDKLKNLESDLEKKRNNPPKNVLAILCIFVLLFVGAAMIDGYVLTTQQQLAEAGIATTTKESNIGAGFAFFWFIHWIIFTFITTNMAKKRGRSSSAAILGAYFFGIFSVIYYSVAGDSTEMRIIKEQRMRLSLKDQS